MPLPGEPAYVGCDWGGSFALLSFTTSGSLPRGATWVKRGNKGTRASLQWGNKKQKSANVTKPPGLLKIRREDSAERHFFHARGGGNFSNMPCFPNQLFSFSVETSPWPQTGRSFVGDVPAPLTCLEMVPFFIRRPINWEQAAAECWRCRLPPTSY